MCSVDEPTQCLLDVLPRLYTAGCAPELDAAGDALRAAVDPRTYCADAAARAAVARDLTPRGRQLRARRCALEAAGDDGALVDTLGFYAAHTDAFVAPRAAGRGPAAGGRGPGPGAGARGAARAWLGALALLAPPAPACGARRRRRAQEGRASRGGGAAARAAVGLVGPLAGRRGARAVAALRPHRRGPFAEDANTASAATLARFPDAVLERRVLSLHVRAGAAAATYARLRALLARADAWVARRQCGHRLLRVGDARRLPPRMTAALLLGGGPALLADGANASLTLRLTYPARAGAAARAAHARAVVAALAPATSPDALGFSSRAGTDELNAAYRVPAGLAAASVALLVACVHAGLAAYMRVREALRVAAAAVALLLVPPLAASAAMLALGVPYSPYTLLSVPLVLGTGVDAMLLLALQRARLAPMGHGLAAWARVALLSVVASHASTMLMCAVGLVVHTPHARNFWAHLLASLGVSLALQHGFATVLWAVTGRCPATEVGGRARQRPRGRRGARTLLVAVLASL